MQPVATGFEQLGETARRIARRFFTILENRLELLMVEVQEERGRLLRAVVLALGAGVFGLLAGITLTAAMVVLLWQYSPVLVLLALTGLYAVGAVFLYRQFTNVFRDWQTFPSTFDQIKKDHACLEKALE